MDGFAGIDVAFAKGKRLPISVCVRKKGRLEPLMLRTDAGLNPPLGRGNAKALDPKARTEFAEEVACYLRAVEKSYDIELKRVAIDAPAYPKRAGLQRREAEAALAERGIRYFSTPSARQFREIQIEAGTHLAKGGAVTTLPNANRLWMLVGFDLFRRLQLEWDCLEVYPQATVVVLGAGATHKHKQAGIEAQLRVGAKYTGWPKPPAVAALFNIGYGLRHDRLDAYLAAWMASLKDSSREPLGRPPKDAIWVPRLSALRAP
jgi:hypothetical protein